MPQLTKQEVIMNSIGTKFRIVLDTTMESLVRLHHI